MKKIGQIRGWVDNFIFTFSNLMISAEKIINSIHYICVCVCVTGLLKINANNNY
jgi:hypothetical protein